MDANPVEKLSLEHWFTNYQLELIKKTHFHLPGSFDVEVTEPVDELGFENSPTSFITALAIKSLGILLDTWPEYNRVYMRTPWGPRLIRPPYVGVNVPILVQGPNGRVLTAVTVLDSHLKSLSAIRRELKEATQDGVASHPLARFISSRGNYWWNRWALKLLAFAVYRIPSVFLSHRGGGVSLSSLLGEGRDAIPLSTMSYGPTGFTVILTSCWRVQGRWWIRVGVGFDHMAAPGHMAVTFGSRLATILSSTLGQKQREERPLDFERTLS